MRIWIVNHYADPPDGLATRSFDIAKRLVEKGHPTTIFVCAFSHYHLRPARRLGWRLWRNEDVDGVMRITKIRLRYRFKIPPGMREKLDRVLASYAEKCPAYQSVKGCIACSWEAEVEER